MYILKKNKQREEIIIISSFSRIFFEDKQRQKTMYTQTIWDFVSFVYLFRHQKQPKNNRTRQEKEKRKKEYSVVFSCAKNYQTFDLKKKTRTKRNRKMNEQSHIRLIYYSLTHANRKKERTHGYTKIHTQIL